MSSEGFRVGQVGCLRFRVSKLNEHFMIGLGGRRAPPADYKEIDVAAYCYIGGTFEVYEKGTRQLQSQRKLTANTVVDLCVTDKVAFYLDGELQHTFRLQGQKMLYAMASFYNLRAEAEDIQWL